MTQWVRHVAFVVISLWATGAAGQTPAPALDFDTFRTRVQPIFTARRDGLQTCLTCHGGKVGTRFRLEPLPEGAADWSAEAARKNFDSARGLVRPGAPMESRLLTHPLDRAAGGDSFHGGGKHWATQTDAEWQTPAARVRGPLGPARPGLGARVGLAVGVWGGFLRSPRSRCSSRPFRTYTLSSPSEESRHVRIPHS